MSSYSQLGVVTTKTLGCMLPKTACPTCLQAQRLQSGGAIAAQMCTLQAQIRIQRREAIWATPSCVQTLAAMWKPEVHPEARIQWRSEREAGSHVRISGSMCSTTSTIVVTSGPCRDSKGPGQTYALSVPALTEDCGLHAS